MKALILRYFLTLCAFLLFSAMAARGALSITLDFAGPPGFGSGGAWSDLHNDAWDGSTTDAEKQAAAEAVIEAAAEYWETAFASSTRTVNQTIDVSWSGLGGTTLATGGTAWFINPPDYTLVNGSLVWDNDGSSTFFVDLTPHENSEWAKSSTRSVDLGGGLVNIERTYYNAGPGEAARDHTDMLSVAIHEIGHALGFLGSYPRYQALDVGGDGDLDLSGGSEVSYTSGHIDETLIVPESPGFPYDTAVLPPPYYPTAMGPSIVEGARFLLSEVDILVVSDMQALNNPNTNPMLIPEPQVGLLALMGMVGMIARRRRRS